MAFATQQYAAESLPAGALTPVPPGGTDRCRGPLRDPARSSAGARPPKWSQAWSSLKVRLTCKMDTGRLLLGHEVMGSRLAGMANTNGVIHGGCVATLADFASGLPIVALWQDDRWAYSLGVSTNINVSFHYTPLEQDLCKACVHESAGLTVPSRR